MHPFLGFRIDGVFEQQENWVAVMGIYQPHWQNEDISAVERRLMVVDSRPDENWQILVENFPFWPEGLRPEGSVNQNKIANSAFRYVTPLGITELREAIAEREIKVSESALVSSRNVAVTAGSMNGIGIAFRACFARGYRKAVYGVPTFRGVHNAIVSAGLSATALPLKHTEEDWSVLEAEASAGPLVVYINLPNNPTGAVATDGYLKMLEKLASSRDVVLLYDAIYDSFRFAEDSCPTPIDLAVSQKNVIIVNSMSKNYGRPGDRVGWIVAHEQVIDAIAPQIEWETVCVSPANQFAAADAIHADNDLLVATVRKGREAYSARTAGHEILDVPLPGGGTQLWLDLRVRDVEAMADFALTEHHLVLTTSCNYAPTLPGYIRFPTGIPVDRLHDGITRLEHVLAEWGDGR